MHHRSFRVAAQARIDGETKVYPFLLQRPLREDDDEPTLVRAPSRTRTRPPELSWDEWPTIVSSAPADCVEQPNLREPISDEDTVRWPAHGSARSMDHDHEEVPPSSATLVPMSGPKRTDSSTRIAVWVESAKRPR